MSLRRASSALKCRAFHLTLTGAVKVWYNRLPPLRIRSWPDPKKAFLKQYHSRRKVEAPVQYLQDMRQASNKTMKSYLTRFTDKITYCEKVTDREALSALKGGLNMNTLFWRGAQSKNPGTYDELVEMIRADKSKTSDTPDHAIIDSNRSHSSPTSGQVLASATLNAVPVLTYENAPAKVGPSGGTNNNRRKMKKQTNRPLEGAKFCTFHQLYGHDISKCKDAPRSSDQSNSRSSKKAHYHEHPHRAASPNRESRRQRDQSPRRRETRERSRGESKQRNQAPANGGDTIQEVDTIIRGPHIGGNTRNTQRNYTREMKDPPMITYIVNQSQTNRMAPITFSQEDSQGVYHPHCDVLVVRAIVARNGLKRMLVDNGSLVNILFGSTFDKMQIEHGLVPWPTQYLDSLVIASSHEDESLYLLRWDQHF
ncbi:uncharacterized protein LOC111400197 [Olea europaea var. sylvestris]|uniref:uncharacterized protein LOC111400197 n=1 Tax=Olea europaea var. sylvestris TaxID=158386 RepID=UPI000C1D2CBE|nr:uncharacterized protein LOC111400197 [Olea europaea var. sylvestris]